MLVDNLDDFWEDIPSKEDAEVQRRILIGLYGREDLEDMAEGRYLGSAFYDHEGRYIGDSTLE